WEWLRDGGGDCSFGDGLAVVDDAANGVHVGSIGGECDGFGNFLVTRRVVLSHHECSDHAAGFAYVQLARPASAVGEFVAAEAESRHFLSDGWWRTAARGEKCEEAAEIVFMLPGDLLSFDGRCLGIAVGAADEVG